MYLAEWQKPISASLAARAWQGSSAAKERVAATAATTALYRSKHSRTPGRGSCSRQTSS